MMPARPEHDHQARWTRQDEDPTVGPDRGFEYGAPGGESAAAQIRCPPISGTGAKPERGQGEARDADSLTRRPARWPTEVETRSLTLAGPWLIESWSGCLVFLSCELRTPKDFPA